MTEVSQRPWCFGKRNATVTGECFGGAGENCPHLKECTAATNWKYEVKG